jgi:hypothetical protein
MRQAMFKKKHAASQPPPGDRKKRGEMKRDLDRRLREIFDPVLEETIPDSLIEVLRRKKKGESGPES